MTLPTRKDSRYLLDKETVLNAVSKIKNLALAGSQTTVF
jgi:hypothetical protein